MQIHCGDVARWLEALSSWQRDYAYSYYATPFYFVSAFYFEMPQEEIKARHILLRLHENANFETIEKTLAAAPQDHRILAKISVPSLRFEGCTHSVGLQIDPAHRLVQHQDPQGDMIRPTLEEKLSQILPNYRLVDHRLRQQRDNYSCSLITFCNLLAWARDEELDGNIHDKLDAIRVRHAPVLLDALLEQIAVLDSPVFGEVMLRQSGFTLEGWKQIAEAVTRRDPALLPDDDRSYPIGHLIRLSGAASCPQFRAAKIG